MLLINGVFQFAYAFYLHHKGAFKQQPEKEIDLGEADPDLLSNYIKLS
jgi:hypothetical protein